MRFHTLPEWLSWLESHHPRKWDLGLARVSAVAARMDLLDHDGKLVLVAGTNGKGSTSAMLEQLLRSAGCSTGLSTSPHLLTFNERIRINGEPVTDAVLMASFDRIDRARADTSLTYFEFGALASLDLFRREAVDFSLLEIGLGGRLDAMNIARPDLTVITSIALDHQDWLGPDLEAIGREKAGILRPGIPLVAGVEMSDSVLSEAAKLGLPVYRSGLDFSVAAADGTWSFNGRGPRGEPVAIGDLPVNPLPLHNAGLALQSLLLLDVPWTPRSVQEGFARVNLQGRYQKIPGPVELLLDVAHNPHAAAYLARRLAQDPVAGRTHAVIGMYADKDCEGFVAALQPVVDDWYLVDLEPPRGESAAGLRRRGGATTRDAMTCDRVSHALEFARARSVPGDRILVCGSFPVVAGALAQVE